MDYEDPVDGAVDLLQQFGLTEYEARCFVALSALPVGTAKQVADVADVPRTRVYDAMRMLEARGLVQVQHTSPRRFRTVRTDEAIETLRSRYESRIDRLGDALQCSHRQFADSAPATRRVRSIVGSAAVEDRVERLLTGAAETVVLVVGDETLLSDSLLCLLADLDDAVDLVVGLRSDDAADRVRERAPDARFVVFDSEWPVTPGNDDARIRTILLADQSDALVSSVLPDGEEQAVIGTGEQNGLVLLVCLLTSVVTAR